MEEETPGTRRGNAGEMPANGTLTTSRRVRVRSGSTNKGRRFDGALGRASLGQQRQDGGGGREGRGMHLRLLVDACSSSFLARYGPDELQGRERPQANAAL